MILKLLASVAMGQLSETLPYRSGGNDAPDGGEARIDLTTRESHRLSGDLADTQTARLRKAPQTLTT
jgi:hypothetical protein